MNMVFFIGQITACGMLVRVYFGPAVVQYNSPCAMCVHGLQAGERTLWGLWILTTITMWLCVCVRGLLMNDRDRDCHHSHFKSSKCQDVLVEHFKIILIVVLNSNYKFFFLCFKTMYTVKFKSNKKPGDKIQNVADSFLTVAVTS